MKNKKQTILQQLQEFGLNPAEWDFTFSPIGKKFSLHHKAHPDLRLRGQVYYLKSQQKYSVDYLMIS